MRKNFPNPLTMKVGMWELVLDGGDGGDSPQGVNEFRLQQFYTLVFQSLQYFSLYISLFKVFHILGLVRFYIIHIICNQCERVDVCM